ncbi:hypothetical protein CD30_05625 [Ureibacillus massiliensis 4400831 = CIP 108448 = CCUG 49529]|uniref:Uncharacterized protein n=1 Tax=Ureibacillus massiliensis 4400831 = CIP 108448 = CCUG 49529 TaxID=1211035 RepID=A0A0A3J3C0_9BACL|nr:hypothetical protein CD30_05625 [Ureibacillus massiliensis 4400831 = CIP 108448 = CCUG 49529]
MILINYCKRVKKKKITRNNYILNTSFYLTKYVIVIHIALKAIGTLRIKRGIIKLQNVLECTKSKRSN